MGELYLVGRAALKFIKRPFLVVADHFSQLFVNFVVLSQVLSHFVRVVIVVLSVKGFSGTCRDFLNVVVSNILLLFRQIVHIPHAHEFDVLLQAGFPHFLFEIFLKL
jgi:hypothetical protein